MLQIKSLRQIIQNYWLFIFILIIGIFARTWEFGNIPAGLNPDEASSGIEAYYIYKYGIDRNGISYPVHLISWGSGQNVFYTYLLIPFVAFAGLSANVIRFPIMLSGILSLPLIYYVGKKLFDEKLALLVMFFLAISPWHIVNTRWAVESNILPFVFLLGFTFLLASHHAGIWFIFSCLCFALCLYTYGTTYIAIPVFFMLTLPLVFFRGEIKTKYIVIGLLLFSLIALPILLFIIINTLKLDPLRLGSITIPRLPVEARYESLAVFFESNPLQSLFHNISIMLKLLWEQEDVFTWNFVEGFGYFYKFTFPLAIVGLFYLIHFIKNSKEKLLERWMLLAWLISAVVIGIVHPVNLTRFNLIFIPIIFLIALCIWKFNQYFKHAIIFTVSLFFIGFIFFNLAYHGKAYEQKSKEAFNAGIIPAIQYASENSDSLICISDTIRFGYIYTLFVSKIHPSEYLNQLEWILPEEHPLDPARTPRAINIFRFQIADCALDPNAVYILKLKELPPNTEVKYKIKRFIKYDVFIPKNEQ